MVGVVLPISDAGPQVGVGKNNMGHSSIDITANVYTHMEAGDAAVSLVRLENYLSGNNREDEEFEKVVKR